MLAVGAGEVSLPCRIFFSLSLGESSTQIEILSQRAVKYKSPDQSTRLVQCMYIHSVAHIRALRYPCICLPSFAGRFASYERLCRKLLFHCILLLVLYTLIHLQPGSPSDYMFYTDSLSSSSFYTDSLSVCSCYTDSPSACSFKTDSPSG